LRARGGFEISLKWKDGELTDGEVKNLAGNKCRIRYGEQVTELQLAKGEGKKFNQSLQ